MSVARCMEEISSAEFTEWIAYSQIEHFGPVIEDLRAGVVAASTYNVARDRQAHPEPFSPKDAIPWLSDDRATGSDEPILFDDPVAQTNLLRAQLFGVRNGKTD